MDIERFDLDISAGTIVDTHGTLRDEALTMLEV